MTAQAVTEIEGKDGFIGWGHDPDLKEVNCDDPTIIERTTGPRSFTISGTHARCCPESAFPCSGIVTGCKSNTILQYDDEGTVECVDGAICQTMRVLPTSLASNEADTTSLIACMTRLSAHTVYREYPGTDSDDSITATATSTNGAASQTDSSNDNPHDDDDGEVWIAGAVLGPIAIIALVFLIWFLRRRSKNKKAAETHSTSNASELGVHGNQDAIEASKLQQSPHQHMCTPPIATMGAPTTASMTAPLQPTELPAEEATCSELPADGPRLDR